MGVDWEFVGGVEGREGLDGRGVNDVIIYGKTCDDTFIIVMYAPQASVALGMPSEDARGARRARLLPGQVPKPLGQACLRRGINREPKRQRK